MLWFAWHVIASYEGKCTDTAVMEPLWDFVEHRCEWGDRHPTPREIADIVHGGFRRYAMRRGL